MFFARKKRDAALKDTIDRLGAVRDALRVLRVREEALLKDLEAYRPPAYVRAHAYELEVQKKVVRRFDRFALPAEMQKDDAYWVSETKQTLTLVPLDPTQKTPTADQIADTYAETQDLPIGLSPEEADYGEARMPSALPAPARPLLGPGAQAGEGAPRFEEAHAKVLAAAEPAKGVDFSGVPRYRTGTRTPSRAPSDAPGAKAPTSR